MNARRLLARFALASGASLAAFLLAEVVARGLGFGAVPKVVRSGQVGFRKVDDERLKFLNRPNCEFEATYAYGDGRPPLVVRGTTNAHGFRGPIVPRRRSGARRVACIGDSYTFGEGVGDDETWPAQLAAELEREATTTKHEVMNCGVNSYDTRQEVRLLETRVLPYDPDLVLLAFFLNDAAVRAEGRFAGVEFGRPSATYRFLTENALARKVRSVSRLADGISDRLVRHEYLVFLGESRSRLYAQDAPGWKMARDELVRAQEILAAREIPFVVILYPLLFRTGETLATHDAYEKVAAHCNVSGIRVLDLEPTFIDADVDRLRVHPADAHPNADGHALAARAIYESLRREGLIDD